MSHLSEYGVSHGIKESALQVPEQALDGMPLGLGLV